MYTRNLLAALSAVLFSSSAWALTVNCAPGELKSLVDKPAQISELTITGTADASDFHFIETSMPALQTLDLSKCAIAAYSGDAINGISEYPAATIPSIIFAGSTFTSISLPATGSVSIAAHAFTGCALTSLTIPANITEIGNSAFAGSLSLESVTLSKASAGEYAFKGCTKLTTVNLGSSTSVGAHAFAECTALSSVAASGLKTIGDFAFNGCTSLDSFEFDKSLSSIGANAFAHSGITEALLQPTAVKSLGNWAFAHCASLNEVSLPKSLTTLGEGVFFDCPELKSINLPSNISELPDYALKGASSLSAANLPEGVTSLGDYSLMNASDITSITLPSTLEHIGTNAMEGMKGLTEINANALKSVPELGSNVWDGIDQSAVTLNADENVADLFKTSPQWENFDIRSIPTAADNPKLDLDSGRTLRGRFEGSLLLLAASGVTIEHVYLYDLNGRLLATANPHGALTSIDTSTLSSDIFIVRCILSDGSDSILKMAR